MSRDATESGTDLRAARTAALSGLLDGLLDLIAQMRLSSEEFRTLQEVRAELRQRQREWAQEDAALRAVPAEAEEAPDITKNDGAIWQMGYDAGQRDAADASGGGEGLTRDALFAAIRPEFREAGAGGDSLPSADQRASEATDRILARLAATPPAPTPASEDGLRAAAGIFAAHVSAHACDHDASGAGTHTGCPERLALDRALAASEGAGLPAGLDAAWAAAEAALPEGGRLHLQRRAGQEAQTLDNGEVWVARQGRPDLGAYEAWATDSTHALGFGYAMTPVEALGKLTAHLTRRLISPASDTETPR